jgi:hypothetical protein
MNLSTSVEDEDMPELGGGPKLGNAFIGSQPGFSLWTELVDIISDVSEKVTLSTSGS